MLGRLRRTTWNWLPAFLEVAETGSIARASRSLALTPAAISRTIRLLEEEVGEPLFNRVGRSLALNTSGASLRDAVRSAVDAVDAGLLASLGDPFVGPLRVASLGVLTQYFVVPALIDLKAVHAGLLPEHLNLGTAEANTLLTRGQLHVAFYYEDVTAEKVVVERLGKTTASVFCGRGHALFEKNEVSRVDVLDHAFSVPQIGDSGRVMDGWPPDVPRQVGMRISMLHSNLEVCRSGELLTVLPDVAAARGVEAGELRRLPFKGLPPIDFFVARHESAIERGAVQTLISAVKSKLKRSNRELKAMRSGD